MCDDVRSSGVAGVHLVRSGKKIWLERRKTNNIDLNKDHRVDGADLVSPLSLVAHTGLGKYLSDVGDDDCDDDDGDDDADDNDYDVQKITLVKR